jgi:LysR family transcriptional activator of glutamate synthase operon
LNIEYLKSVIEAGKRKSFSKASEKLNITHPALSKQIKKTEEFFGVTLFTRSSTGVELTSAGDIFCQRATGILNEFELLKREMLSLVEKRTFSIGTLPSIASNFLPVKVMELKMMGIGVKTEIKHTSLEILELLQERKIDIAIIDYDRTEGFSWSKLLFEEPLFIVAPNNHRLAQRQKVSIEDIRNEELVLYPPACSIRRKVTKLLENRGIDPIIHTEVDFGDYIMGFVSAGGGITIAPKITTELLGHPNLVAIPIQEKEAIRKIYVVSLSESSGSYVYNLLKNKK